MIMCRHAVAVAHALVIAYDAQGPVAAVKRAADPRGAGLVKGYRDRTVAVPLPGPYFVSLSGPS
jgi:hypothetical protein